MSALEKLGSSLAEAIRKIIKAPVVDEAVVKELVRDFRKAKSSSISLSILICRLMKIGRAL